MMKGGGKSSSGQRFQLPLSYRTDKEEAYFSGLHCNLRVAQKCTYHFTMLLYYYVVNMKGYFNDYRYGNIQYIQGSNKHNAS
jgi:hypothetical protein